MPIYCYKCSCGNKWESFTHTSEQQDDSCPICGNKDIGRDYEVETKVVFSDIPEHYDFSIGEVVKGRRDRLTKYKSRGLRPLQGADCGDSVKPFKTYYNDEKLLNNNTRKINPIDTRLENALKQSFGEGSELNVGSVQK